MNTLGIVLAWGAVQVTLFAAVGTAIYAIVRRRGPAAGSLAALASLLIVLAVSVLVFSPWPQWYSAGAAQKMIAANESAVIHPEENEPQRDGSTLAAEPTSTAEQSEQAGATSNNQGQNATDVDARATAAAFWQAFVAELRPAPVAEQQPARRWPGVVAAVLGLGVLLGVGRLALGLLAVRRLRAAALPITDEAVLRHVDRLREQLGCHRTVEIRESGAIATPATIGWRRPLVILPLNWRAWTDREQDAVLAHEIAHVCRADYAAAIIAQMCLAVHFYHPLVHWLARRLRLEQELAADALGARVAGGREQYLRSLAALALAQDNRRLAWAARPFLPETGTLLRRIEMLRDRKQQLQASLSRAWRVGLVAILVAAGLGIAGLRGPSEGGANLAQAAPPTESERNVRAVVEGYVAAALAGKAGDAFELAVSGKAPAQRDQIEEFKTLLSVESIKIPTVRASDAKGHAFAVSEKVKITDPNPDGRDTGVLTFGLVKQKGKWLLDDIDFDTEARAEKKLKAFLQQNPDAAEVPTKPRPNADVDKPKPAAPSDGMEFSLDYVPANANFVVAIRPQEIARHEALKPLLPLADAMFRYKERYGFSVQQLAEIYLLTCKTPEFAGGYDELMIFRLLDPVDVNKQVAHFVKQPIWIGGEIVQTKDGAESSRACLVPDVRTFVVGSLHTLRQFRQQDRGPQPRWAAQWKAVAENPVALALDVKAIRGDVERELSPTPGAAPWIKLAAPLWEQTDTVVAGATVGDKLALHATAVCVSPEGAEKVQETSKALITLALNMLDSMRADSDAGPKGTPAAALATMKPFFDMGEKALKSVKFSQAGATLEAHAEVPLDSLAVAAVLAPAVSASRVAAQRTQSMNNMKQIALALHNYADKYGKLPPAIVIGPDGKTPHSWRVEILPYLEADNLYQQYKLDEPWDSQNNRKVLAQMPPQFRDPNDDPKSTNASYFTVTGDSAAFSGKEGNKFHGFTDGMSNTIMVVEAQRDVPWTKPEDIAYDPEKPLPALGGHYKEGFLAGLADGSVRRIGKGVDEKVLRALFTKAGGEVVKAPN